MRGKGGGGWQVWWEGESDARVFSNGMTECKPGAVNGMRSGGEREREEG